MPVQRNRRVAAATAWAVFLFTVAALTGLKLWQNYSYHAAVYAHKHAQHIEEKAENAACTEVERILGSNANPLPDSKEELESVLPGRPRLDLVEMSYSPPDGRQWYEAVWSHPAFPGLQWRFRLDDGEFVQWRFIPRIICLHTEGEQPDVSLATFVDGGEEFRQTVSAFSGPFWLISFVVWIRMARFRWFLIEVLLATAIAGTAADFVAPTFSPHRLWYNSAFLFDCAALGATIGLYLGCRPNAHSVTTRIPRQVSLETLFAILTVAAICIWGGKNVGILGISLLTGFAADESFVWLSRRRVLSRSECNMTSLAR